MFRATGLKLPPTVNYFLSKLDGDTHQEFHKKQALEYIKTQDYDDDNYEADKYFFQLQSNMNCRELVENGGCAIVPSHQQEVLLSFYEKKAMEEATRFSVEIEIMKAERTPTTIPFEPTEKIAPKPAALSTSKSTLWSQPSIAASAGLAVGAIALGVGLAYYMKRK